jgi:hypothetical protein
MADLYTYFIEKGISLLRNGGRFGYIVANKWMRANYGEPLRDWLLKQRVEEITDFGDLPVFVGATTYPCILIISKNPPAEEIQVTNVDTLGFTNLLDYQSQNHRFQKHSSFGKDSWSLSKDNISIGLIYDQTRFSKLGKLLEGKIFRGVLTGLNDAFIIDPKIRGELIAEDPNCEELIKPFLMGRDIKRYQNPQTERYLIFTRRGIDINKYPSVLKYLTKFKTRLSPRPKGFSGIWNGRKPGPYKWYEIQDSIDYFREFNKPKLILPDISLRGNFQLDSKGEFFCVNTAYIMVTDEKYLLGILNSKLITFIYKDISSSYRGGYLRFIYQYLVQLPIRTIDFNDPADVKRHERMVALVENMLGLHKRLAAAGSPQEKELLQRQIAYTDREIDALVYELYGLTDEEIRIVEGGE